MLSPLLLATALCLEPGATLERDVDVGFRPIYGATFRSDDPNIARANGTVAPRSSAGRVTAYAEREGQTTLSISFVSGISVYRMTVARILVGDPLAVTVTAPAGVPDGSPVTLVAHATGPIPPSVAWYEGATFLGIGNQLTLTLPRGVHRIRAEAWNDCGTVVDEVEISVGVSRRRAARH